MIKNLHASEKKDIMYLLLQEIIAPGTQSEK
jgi:hypothetical protein